MPSLRDALGKDRRSREEASSGSSANSPNGRFSGDNGQPRNMAGKPGPTDGLDQGRSSPIGRPFIPDGTRAAAGPPSGASGQTSSANGAQNGGGQTSGASGRAATANGATSASAAGQPLNGPTRTSSANGQSPTTNGASNTTEQPSNTPERASTANGTTAAAGQPSDAPKHTSSTNGHGPASPPAASASAQSVADGLTPEEQAVLQLALGLNDRIGNLEGINPREELEAKLKEAQEKLKELEDKLKKAQDQAKEKDDKLKEAGTKDTAKDTTIKDLTEALRLAKVGAGQHETLSERRRNMVLGLGKIFEGIDKRVTVLEGVMKPKKAAAA